MAALPLGKLFGVMLKAVSKPLANQLKARAKNSERFDKWTVLLGNQIHRLQVRVFRQSSGLDSKGGLKKVKDLSPEKALDVGATFVGESFLFLVAAGVTIAEFSRSRAKEAKKALMQKMEEERLEREFAESVALRDQKIAQLMEELPVINAKIDNLRAEFESFQFKLVRSLDILNVGPPGPTVLTIPSDKIDSIEENTES